MTKIMLVEDDNNLREIYEARLLAEGYEIISAKDGEEALSLAMKEKPDLIISDVMMPKISGFDMLDLLRSTPETRDTKVIMMTALSQAEDKNRADKLGADRYLVKSQVTLEDVAKVAREVLNGESAPGATTDASTAPIDTAVTPVATPPAPAPTSDPVTTAAPIDEPVTPASDASATVPSSTDDAAAASSTPDPSTPPPADPTTPVDAPVSDPVQDPAPTVVEPTAEAPEMPTPVATPTEPVQEPAAEPAPETSPEPVEPPTAPAASTDPSQAAGDVDQNLTTPAKEESAQIESQIKEFVDTVPSNEEPVPEPAPEATPAEAPTPPQEAAQPSQTLGEPESTTTIPVKTPPPVPTAQESSAANVAHKKVIQPINDLSATGSNLNELLEKEQLKEAGAAAVTPVTPPSTSVEPGGAPVTPPAAGQPADPHAPGATVAPSGDDPANVAL